MLKEYMEDIAMFSPELNLNKIKNALRKQFDEDKNFTIDLNGVRAISPSFAYQCFGRLYDDKKDLEKLINRINVLNDSHNFKDKIIDAIRRRIIVLSRV